MDNGSVHLWSESLPSQQRMCVCQDLIGVNGLATLTSLSGPPFGSFWPKEESRSVLGSTILSRSFDRDSGKSRATAVDRKR
jgi:hypothetical protein